MGRLDFIGVKELQMRQGRPDKDKDPDSGHEQDDGLDLVIRLGPRPKLYEITAISQGSMWWDSCDDSTALEDYSSRGDSFEERVDVGLDALGMALATLETDEGGDIVCQGFPGIDVTFLPLSVIANWSVLVAIGCNLTYQKILINLRTR